MDIRERVKVLVYGYVPRRIEYIEKAMSIADKHAGCIVSIKRVGTRVLIGIMVDTYKDNAENIAKDIVESLKSIGATDIYSDIIPSACLI